MRGAPTLDRAIQLALRYISGRERTIQEVRGYLIAKLQDGDLAEQAIAEFVEQGLLDDARYARVFTEDKILLEAWGTGRIRRGLLARGVAASIADQALEAAGGGERERALEILCRRFPNGVTEHRDRERAFGVLVRKGYDSEMASDTVGAWARGQGSPGDP